MEETLKKYLQSVEKEALKYKTGELETKEYIQSMRDLEEWLEERCDENSRH